VVRLESAPKLLTTPEQKLELLDATGYLDLALVVHFDEARSEEPAEEFVHEVLVDAAHARLVVVGADFHFGNGRGGDVALLQHMGAEHGFEALAMGLEASADGTIYSSTRIRQLLAGGDVAGAAQLLGRPHEVRGVVVEGDKRGRELGFPTANVTVPGRLCLPADGIYAGTFAGDDGIERLSAISLGRRPTFYETAKASLLEAHVLDFDGALYGQSAKVRFHQRLRGEVKFDSIDALISQMEQDVAAVRARLGA